MKNLVLFIIVGMLTFNACKQDQQSAIDINALKKSMNSDPEVSKLRSLLFSHTRLLAAMPQPELSAILSQLHSCGLYSSTATMEELANCLRNTPLKEEYLEFQRQYRAYDEQEKVVYGRFPELSQLNAEKRADLLLSGADQHAEEVLSDYLSTQKNK